MATAFCICFWFAIVCTFLWAKNEDKKLHPEKYMNWIK